ncbi:MAG: hypothetical protein FWD71_14990 [Oscillospiraceae bacterium]|nr:hypothetical protein [Oscillospiraceae bacterium]
MSKLNDDEKLVYTPVIAYLTELGYTPRTNKKRNFVVEYAKKGKAISKMEINNGRLMFWLRFSGCKEYSRIFQDAVKRHKKSWAKGGQALGSLDISKCCGCCKSENRYYHFTDEKGEKINRCGVENLLIEGITSDDVPEILRLMKEQDEYFNNIC